MNLLLDTCTLLWWWSEPEQLSPRVLALLKSPSNTVYVSSATAWEVATKFRKGKLPLGGSMIVDWHKRLIVDGFVELPISIYDALKAGSLEGEHKDPFDRMLAAQSLVSGFPVVTSDTAIEGLGAQRVW